MKLLVTLITLTLLGTTIQKCGFDLNKQRNMIHHIDAPITNLRNLQDKSWTPIRIYIDYTHLDSQASEVSSSYISNLKKVVNDVVSAYQSILKVKQPDYLLKLTPQQSQCTTTTHQISQEIQNTGVKTDIVIFPEIDLTAGDELEASAGTCGNDPNNNRPVFGVVSFSKFLDFSKTNAHYYMSLLVFHEMDHIFAFNEALFEYFVDSNSKVLGLDKVVKTKKINGVNRKLVITPKVVEKARAHFGCNSLEGVELEEGGGAGTAGSHWELRTMTGDVMIGQSWPENVISDITLAMFEDSGWYQVNYIDGGLFKFGKNAGCDFVNSKCITNNTTKFPNEYSMLPYGSEVCSASKTTRGISTLNTGRDITNTAYRYFSDDPSKGGYELADFCPIAAEFGADSAYFENSCWNGKVLRPELGETIDSQSNCFISSLTEQGNSKVSSYKGKNLAICYKKNCNFSSGTYTVEINSKTVTCPKEGGRVSLDGYDGAIVCPDFNFMCTHDTLCSDVFDCINKKITRKNSSFSYTPSKESYPPNDPNEKTVVDEGKNEGGKDLNDNNGTDGDKKQDESTSAGYVSVGYVVVLAVMAIFI